MPAASPNARRLRVLLDEQVSKSLKKLLTDHDVWTVKDQRLDGLRDGPLLDAIDGRFDILVTHDKSLPFQNRIHARSFAIIVLRAKRISINTVMPLIPALLTALAVAKPGEVIEIGG